MKKHRPARRPDDPRNGNTGAMGSQLVAALPAAHCVHRSATVELRPSLAQPKQRRASKEKGKNPGVLVQTELLDDTSPLIRDPYCGGLEGNREAKCTYTSPLRARSSQKTNRSAPEFSYQASRRWDGPGHTLVCNEDTEAESMGADRGDLEFGISIGALQALAPGLGCP